MKNVAGIIAVLILTAFSFGEIVDEDGYTRAMVDAKMHKFKNMRTTGLVMLGGAGTLIVSGIVCMSNADWESYSTYNGGGVTTNDASGAVGIMLTIAGVPITVAGIVLTSIGNKKYKEYKTRLRLFSGYNPLNHEISAGLSYRF